MNCVYWEQLIDIDEHLGECRIKAPTSHERQSLQIAIKCPTEKEKWIRGRAFPVTCRAVWCNEFQENYGKEREEEQP
jgi:hypothetical protein